MNLGKQGKISDEVHQRIRTYIIEQVDAETALQMDPRVLERTVGKIVAEAVVSMRLFLNGFEQRTLTREIVDDMVRLAAPQ